MSESTLQTPIQSSVRNEIEEQTPNQQSDQSTDASLDESQNQSKDNFQNEFKEPLKDQIQTNFSDELQAKDQSVKNDLEFDCPESISFKDPNIDDLIDVKENTNVKDAKIDIQPRLIRNRTHTRLYRAVTDKKVTLSPITKKKKSSRTILYTNRKPITNINERLYNAAQRRAPTYKTLAELVQEFDKKTRVYDDENMTKKKLNNLKTKFEPKSPKLLSKNRNRIRTALSQLEQDELIARSIKKNTFKAQPINKRIFNNYAMGIPKVQCVKKCEVKSFEFSFHSNKRSEMRKEKMQEIQNSIDNVNNFVFKARPMPVFKKVPIALRNNQLIKKQTSDMFLNKTLKNMTNTIVKQTSDSTLSRIVQDVDLMINREYCEDKKEDLHEIVNDGDKNSNLNTAEVIELMSKSLNENLSTFRIEEEISICETKSLEGYEGQNKAHENLDLKSFDLNNHKIGNQSETISSEV